MILRWHFCHSAFIDISHWSLQKLICFISEELSFPTKCDNFEKRILLRILKHIFILENTKGYSLEYHRLPYAKCDVFRS